MARHLEEEEGIEVKGIVIDVRYQVDREGNGRKMARVR